MTETAAESTHGIPTGLLLLLSAAAGATDAIGFLALDGLFTAHITGNIVILASHLVTHGTARLAELLSVPVFMIVLALARLLCLSLSSRGDGAALQTLLVLQVVFLLGFLLLGLGLGRTFDADAPLPLLAGMCGVAAMAVQNALVQTELPGAPSTAVLTTSITRFTIAVVEALAGQATQRDAARGKVAVLFPPIIGFLGGCVMGALLAWRMGLPALLLPTFLATAAALVAMRREAPDGRVISTP